MIWEENRFGGADRYVTLKGGAFYSTELPVQPGDKIFGNMTRIGPSSYFIGETWCVWTIWCYECGRVSFRRLCEHGHWQAHVISAKQLSLNVPAMGIRHVGVRSLC